MNRFKMAWLVLLGRVDPMAHFQNALDETNKRNELVKQLRFMDEKVFLMSQSLSPDEMRKHFIPAVDAMMARKKTESDRIAEILIPQIEATYGKPK